MEIIYHGHSCVQLVADGKSLLIDPFLRGNPIAVAQPADIEADCILLTHGHTDHMLDAEPIARANDAPIVAIFELAGYLARKQLKTIEINMGGTVDLGFARAKMIQAFHSSSIMLEEGQMIYGGMPAGYIVRMGGFTVLHAGDTALYGDMRMIGERHAIDAAFIPIGDKFTMGPDDALQAAAWYGAKLVIPVHYNSFPAIRQDAENFVRRLEAQGQRGQAMAPGDRITL